MENRTNGSMINWILAAVSLLIFALITIAIVLFPEISIMDMSVLKAVQAILVNYPVSVAKQVSSVGASHCLLWPQLTAISALFSHKKYVNGIFLVIFTQIAWHLPDIIKNFVARERPCGEMCSGYSFPSSHSATTICFYGILIYLVLHYVKNKFWRYSLTTIFSVFIFLVAISRMKLNVHFPLDVLAGLCLGFMLLNLFIVIVKTFESHNIE